MKKFVLFFSCLLLVGCHQESNNTKTTQSSERIQTSSSSISSQEESKDYSDWYLDYKYYYVQSDTSSLMFGGLSLNNDGTAILGRSGAEIMARNQGRSLLGTYTIEEYEGSDSIQTYVTSENTIVNGEEPSRTTVMPSVKIVINISSEDLKRVNGTSEFLDDQTTEVLYGYTNDKGNKVLTTGEGNQSAMQVYFHRKPDKTEYVVNADEVNLRSKPSLTSDIIGSRQKGDIIQVSDWVNGDKYNDISSWWEVSVDGKRCYVWSGALQAKSVYDYEQQSVKDIDLSEISNGNYESLAGTWANGKGDTLVIQADGSVVGTVSGRTGEGSLGGAFRYESDGIPYIGMNNGLVALLKIGFKTEGDNSDTSKPRIVPTQNGVPDSLGDIYYYYRQ